MLSEKEFKDLCTLARLDPEDETIANLRGDFNTILDFVDRIKQIQLEKSEASRAVNETLNVSRPDQAVEPPGTAVLAEFAPDFEAGHFVVPGVLDQEH